MGLQGQRGFLQHHGVQARGVSAHEQDRRVLRQAAHQSAVHALPQIATALKAQGQTAGVGVLGLFMGLVLRLDKRRVRGVGAHAQLQRSPRHLRGLLHRMHQQLLGQVRRAFGAQGRHEPGFGLPRHRGFGEDDQGGVHR